MNRLLSISIAWALLLQVATAQAQTPKRLVYDGGPVMTGPLSVYLLWYGKSSSTHMSRVITFARYLSGSSWFDMMTTFTDARGRRIAATYPVVAAAFDDQYSLGKTLSQSDAQTFIRRSIDNGRLPWDPNGVYMILPANDVTVQNSPSNPKCGERSRFNFRGAPIKYTVMYNPSAPGTDPRCNIFRFDGRSPNGNTTTDSMIYYLAHEFAEALVSPELNGWRVRSSDGTTEEVADACVKLPLGEERTPSGARYNVVLGGRYYWLRSIFKNVNGGLCAISH